MPLGCKGVKKPEFFGSHGKAHGFDKYLGITYDNHITPITHYRDCDCYCIFALFFKLSWVKIPCTSCANVNTLVGYAKTFKDSSSYYHVHFCYYDFRVLGSVFVS